MDYQQEWVTFLKWKVEYLERNLPRYLGSGALTLVLTIVVGGGGIFSVFQWLVEELPLWAWVIILIAILVATLISGWFGVWRRWLHKIRHEREKNNEERKCLLKLIALILGKQVDTADKIYEGYKRCQQRDFDEWCSQIEAAFKIRRSPE